jgi:hypothetical protein
MRFLFFWLCNFAQFIRLKEQYQGLLKNCCKILQMEKCNKIPTSTHSSTTFWLKVTRLTGLHILMQSFYAKLKQNQLVNRRNFTPIKIFNIFNSLDKAILLYLTHWNNNIKISYTISCIQKIWTTTYSILLLIFLPILLSWPQHQPPFSRYRSLIMAGWCPQDLGHTHDWPTAEPPMKHSAAWWCRIHKKIQEEQCSLKLKYSKTKHGSG